MDIKDSAAENSERSEKHYRENLDFLWESLNHHEQTVLRNVDFKNNAGEDSEGGGKHVIGTGGRRILVVWWQKP